VDLGIEGKTALVLGASRGIGRGIAGVLAREGANVAVSSRSGESLEEAVAEIGAGATAFPADAADLEGMSALPGEVAEKLGPVEILVTNTGGPPFGGALDNSSEEWDAAYRTLVRAPQELIRASLPGMIDRGWGRIVNVSSSSVREPIPHLTLSNAMRMAAVGYFKTLAGEVAANGITVNTVATGRFATERLLGAEASEEDEKRASEGIPAGRLGTPEEYGDLVAFLCSDRAAFLTGTVIPLDGGMLRSA
jgi:3-oxoacyl-[acyl-carrier protein] reductase